MTKSSKKTENRLKSHRSSIKPKIVQKAKNRPTIQKSNQRPEIDKNRPNSQELTKKPNIDPKAKNQTK